MASYSQAHPRRPETLEHTSPLPASPWGGLLIFAGLTLAALGCSGGKPTSGDHAGQLNGKFQITPPAAMVFVGQTTHFSASSPWGGDVLWSVLPATGGTIDGSGDFTAASSPGQYQIVAMWTRDVRYTATATVSVLPSPPPAQLNLGMVQAFGHLQGSVDGSIRNAPVAGEPVPAKQASSASESLQLRHGFYLPPAR